MTTATAPGKIILVGEHAVVYGRPAIAVPVWQVQASATVEPAPPGRGLRLRAPDVGIEILLSEAPADFPPALVTRLALAAAGAPPNPDWDVTVRSDIPIAGGLGSGAALSTALVRVLFAHAGRQPTPDDVSAIVYESERHYHGTPSGIDNTVIAWGQPIWFVRDASPVPFSPRIPFTLLIADSGIASPTRETVADVRRGWQEAPELFERHFDALADLAYAARIAIETGTIEELGSTFDRAHVLLDEMGVSSPALDALVQAARAHGALGAKLSGGGRGGNVIALVTQATAGPVQSALAAAGAQRVIETTVR